MSDQPTPHKAETATAVKAKTGTFIEEFKSFALKGNAVDMAVGIILGAAFNKIVNSIVNDLLMPPLGLAIGGVNFEDLRVVLKPAENGLSEVAVRYGMFVNTVIEFLIISMTVFVVVKLMNKLISRRD
jgi:large conductance mechanosensitive channel